MSNVKIEWFSGTGKGGQHRNKHQNCCRATHLPTGLTALGTESRSRESNKKLAMARLGERVRQHLHKDTERYRASAERVRTYHAPRNQVIDHASGKVFSYKDTLQDIGPAIEARLRAKGGE